MSAALRVHAPEPGPSPARFSPAARAALCLLAGLPFASAALAARLPDRPAAVAAGSSTRSLAFEQYLVNLGPVPAVREVAGRFTFRNAGPRAIRITALEPSCGCLNPRLEKRDYAPGEFGSFHVRVQTASEKAGPHEFTVKVRYEEPSEGGAPPTPREPVELAFKLVIPEKQVSIRPRALVFYQLGTQATSQEVLIVDERGGELELTGVSSSSPLVTAEVAGTRKTDGLTEHTLRITVSAEAPAGRMRALVTVRTSDPAYRVLQVPLIIQGPERTPRFDADHVRVEPPQVVFPSAAGALTQPREVTIAGPAGQPFRVTEVTSSSPAVSASVVEAGEAQGSPQVRLRVFLTAEATAGHRDILTVKTSSPTQPELQIPVSVGGSVQQTAGRRDAAER